MSSIKDQAVAAVIAELQRQSDDGKPGPYVDMDDPSDAVIDGHVDLIALVEAVLASAERNVAFIPVRGDMRIKGTVHSTPPRLHVPGWPNPMGATPESVLHHRLKVGGDIFLIIGSDGDDLLLEPYKFVGG